MEYRSIFLPFSCETASLIIFSTSSPEPVALARRVLGTSTGTSGFLSPRVALKPRRSGPDIVVRDHEGFARFDEVVDAFEGDIE